MKVYEMDFETNITVITAQDYMDEVDYTEDDLKYDWGQVYKHYVRAQIVTATYCMRLFAPIKGSNANSLQQAINAVMQELLKDYNAHMRKVK